uniref:DUF1612 domain-containing protein n=1 Tax=Macrostomum lignano TaxID=282301 RepID=A0A1I8FJ61_9PLAT
MLLIGADPAHGDGKEIVVPEQRLCSLTACQRQPSLVLSVNNKVRDAACANKLKQAAAAGLRLLSQLCLEEELRRGDDASAYCRPARRL